MPRSKTPNLPDHQKYCGAELRGDRAGRTCRSPTTIDSRHWENGGRCRMHGGTQKTGIASPNATQDGKWSKYITTPSMREQYDALATDRDRMTMQDDMVLTATFMASALGRIGEGAAASSSTLRNIRKAYDDLDAHQRAGNRREAAVAFVRLGQHIDKALDERNAQDEVIRLSDHRRKLVESELKLVVTKRAVMTAEESNALIHALASAVFDEVQDDETRVRIAFRFASLINLPRPEAIAV